jgi:hypothetical protein
LTWGKMKDPIGKITKAKTARSMAQSVTASA